MNWLFYAPLVPLATHGIVVARFHRQMSEVLSEDEQDREAHRALILAFAGFSFTGVTALIVLEPTVQQNLRDAVFFLLVSFLTYLWALNIQGYKAARWHGEAAAALAETGSLSLVLALISLLITSEFESAFVSLTGFLALGVWTIDHVTRLRIDWCYLLARERKHPHGVASGEKGKGGKEEGGPQSG